MSLVARAAARLASSRLMNVSYSECKGGCNRAKNSVTIGKTSDTIGMTSDTIGMPSVTIGKNVADECGIESPPPPPFFPFSDKLDSKTAVIYN
jgi:hypothetical protein